MTPITRLLKREFTETELEDMSETVFSNIDSVRRLKSEKKASNKLFGEKIKTLEETNNEFAHLIQEGHEWIDIACEVKYNHPTAGKKTITRLDTQEQWIEQMEPHENTIDNLAGINSGFNDEEE